MRKKNVSDIIHQIVAPIALGVVIVNNALVIVNEPASKTTAAFTLMLVGALIIINVIRFWRATKILRRAERNTKRNDDEQKVSVIVEPASIAHCIKCGRDATNVRITSESMEFYCCECNDKENKSNDEATPG